MQSSSDNRGKINAEIHGIFELYERGLSSDEERKMAFTLKRQVMRIVHDALTNWQTDRRTDGMHFKGDPS